MKLYQFDPLANLLSSPLLSNQYRLQDAERATEHTSNHNLREQDSDRSLSGDADKANWVTQPNLNTLDEFKEVLSLLTEGMKEVLGFSGVRFDEMLITSLRAYRHTTPNLGPQEVRPNNLLSGVLFLKTDKKGVVTFFDPRPQAWIIKPPVSEANIFNSDAFSIESQENKMLVFPAWLQYQVAFKEGMEENIYLSWTAMIRGGAKSN